jgi:retinoid hydroxylase
MKINKGETLPLPPGNLGLPYFGETAARNKDFIKFYQKRQQKYGDIFKTRLRGTNYIIINNSEANKFILSNENSYFINSSLGNSKSLFGTKILTWQRGQQHKNSRKVLAQAFQNRAFDRYINVIQTISHNYFLRWRDKNISPEKPELKQYVYDVMDKILFGIDTISQTETISWLESLPSALMATPLLLPWTKYGNALQNRQKLLSRVDEAIALHHQQNDYESSALGILIQAQQQAENFDSEELKMQIINLWFLGSKELASALMSFCREIEQHQEYLEQIISEQKQFNRSRNLSLEKLKKMTYLEQFIKEVLRLNPPVPASIRQVIQECSFREYRLPVGWNIMFRIDATLRDRSIYSQPDRFDPNRFNNSRAEDKQQPYSYIPFGGGMRECMGKELSFLVMKIFAIELLDSKTKFPNPNLSAKSI